MEPYEQSDEADMVRALVSLRKAHNMTQKELAVRTGITQGDISKLETGKSNPSLRTLQRLAGGMGCHIKLEFLPARKG